MGYRVIFYGIKVYFMAACITQRQVFEKRWFSMKCHQSSYTRLERPK